MSIHVVGANSCVCICVFLCVLLRPWQWVHGRWWERYGSYLSIIIIAKLSYFFVFRACERGTWNRGLGNFIVIINIGLLRGGENHLGQETNSICTVHAQHVQR